MVNVVSKELREILNRQKRAQYSRIRYHSMDPVLRSSFNEKRSKRYFIKKKKERALLSMSLNKLTADEYLEVQQISKRRKARSEKARLRYHKLSLEEKKIYNEKCIKRGKLIAISRYLTENNKPEKRPRGRPKKKYTEKI